MDCAITCSDATTKASPMSEQTLKDRVLGEVRAETWDVPEIGKQLGCGERMVFYHFRQGLTSRVVNHRRVSTPAEVEQYLRRRYARAMSGANMPQK
jgi:hypothetical protein